MTDNEIPLEGCGIVRQHKAHRYFEADALTSRPCSGEGVDLRLTHSTASEGERAGILGRTTLAERAAEARESEDAARAQAARRKAADGPERHELSAFGAQVLRDTTALETQRRGRVQRAPQDRSADGVPEVEQESRPLDLSLAIAECKRFEEIDRAAVARGESADWWERGTPTSAPAPTLADDVAELRDALKPLEEIAPGYHYALVPILDRIAGTVPQRATDLDVVRAARRWYREHGYTPGYLPRNVLSSDRDLKAAVEALGGE